MSQRIPGNHNNLGKNEENDTKSRQFHNNLGNLLLLKTICQSVDQKLKFLVKFFQIIFEKNMKTNGGLSDSYPKIFLVK